MSQNPFEIPQQMRDLVEKNVDQARLAYGQFMDAMTQAMSFWTKSLPANDVSSGFRAVQDRATKFAKQNAEAAFGLRERSRQRQGHSGSAGASEPPRAVADASLCAAGAGTGRLVAKLCRAWRRSKGLRAAWAGPSTHLRGYAETRYRARTR